MGAIFARTVQGLDRPTVGLLNVGSEDMKGHEELKVAAGILRGGEFPFEFHGFVEGDDITGGTVDVVVSDLGMPDMTGWDVARAIQGRWPQLPVGLITGWGETEITREERSRVNFVITKPFDKAVLRETMSDIRPRS